MARRFLQATLTVIFTLTMFPLLGVSPAVADSAAVGGVSSFQGCVAGSHGPVDVLIMMDVTQSLTVGDSQNPATDPRNLRIVGLRAALRSMASEHDVSGGQAYNVQMVGFGQRVETFPSGAGLSTWTPVTDAALPTLYASTSVFTKPNPGTLGAFTNFDTALQWANQQLLATTASCKAILWFTDGALDLSNNGQAFPQTRNEINAMSDICGPGGAAVALWKNNVWDFVVGLTNAQDSKGADTLKSIAVGGSGNYLFPGVCGANPNGVSTSTQTGAYFGSPQAAQLIFEMQGLICSGSACQPSQLQPCVINAASCPSNSSYPFWIGPGIASFTFDGDIPGIGGAMGYPEFQVIDTTTNESIVLSVSPSGFSCRLPNGQKTGCNIDGASLTASTLTRGEIRVVGLVSSTITSGHSLVGIFKVPAGTMGSATQTFFENSGVDLAFVPNRSLDPTCPAPPNGVSYIGCLSSGTLAAYYKGTRNPFPLSLGRISSISINLAGTTHDQIPVEVMSDAESHWRYAFRVPPTASEGNRFLVASGTLDFVQSGSRVWSINASLSQTVSFQSAPGFPAVHIGSRVRVIQVGSSFSVPVTVTGSSTGVSGGGCVSKDVSGLSISGAANLRIEKLRSNLPTACRQLGVGESKTYRVSGILARGSDGSFFVTLRLRLGSSTTSLFEEPQFTIPLQANVPVNVGGSVLLLAALIALALIGLLAVSALVNWFTGRFPPLTEIYMTSVPARVTITGVVGEDGESFSLPAMTVESLVSHDDAATRQFTDKSGGRINFFASKASFPVGVVRGFFRGPESTVESPTFEMLVGNGYQVEGPGRGPFRIDRSLKRGWAFTVDSVTGDTPETMVVHGQVTIWFKQDSGIDFERLLVDVRVDIAGKFLELAKLASRSPKEILLPTSGAATTNGMKTDFDDSDIQSI